MTTLVLSLLCRNICAFQMERKSREPFLSFHSDFKVLRRLNRQAAENCALVMTDRKFFTGLPEAMMTRSAKAPDRQQTNFYWPDETDCEQIPPSRNRLRNRTMSNASLMSQSQASTDTEESRRRKSKQNQSKIEFYDMVDVGTDNESVYSRVDDKMKRNRQDTLKSRIEFYDFVDTRSYQPDEDAQSVIERPVKRIAQPSAAAQMTSAEKDEEKAKIQVKSDESEQTLAQGVHNLSISVESRNGHAKNHKSPSENGRKKVPEFVDSFSESDDDERYYRARNRVVEERKYLPAPPRYPPSTRSVRSHPRRVNSEYFDFDDEEYDRQYDSRRPKYRKPENIPRMARRRDYSPEISDEEFYEPIDDYRRGGGDYFRPRVPLVPERYRSNASRLDETESYYRGRNNRKPGNGYANDFEQRSPPIRRPSPLNQDIEPEAPPNNHVKEPEPTPKMPASARPPVKPSLSRTESVNQARQRLHVNLKSNIFHNNPDYNEIVEQRKPASIREFAGGQRVGVGLPDI